MWGSRTSWLQRAIGATAWLWLLCAAGACTGPGLEPPGDPSESAGGPDAGDDLGSGGSAASGGAGAGGTAGVPTTDPGDGDTPDRDAGEASEDASVDDDGGTDPEELEP